MSLLTSEDEVYRMTLQAVGKHALDFISALDSARAGKIARAVGKLFGG